MATDPMLDPSYKYSINRFTGNGSKTSWDLNFAGGYIRREHVKAYREAADGQITELSFTWSGPNTVVISPPVPMGVTLVVYRDTPKNAPLVDFTDGAIINEYDLDLLARQTVYATAEMVDRFADVSVEFEVVTATSNLALQTANNATATASSALLAAQGAVTTANGAVVIANNADTKANGAVSTANAANNTATAANNTANAANNTAGLANQKADQALQTANNAAGQAASAVLTAGDADTKATNALARSISAETVAANAELTAGAAEAKADNVRAEFDNLADTVEEIAGGDLTNFVRVTQENTFQRTQKFQVDGGPGFEVYTPDGLEGWRVGNRGAVAFRTNGEWQPAVGFINDWNGLYNKPTTFPPSAHGHSIAEVVGLGGVLDAKANSSDMNAALNGKYSTNGGVLNGDLVRGTGNQKTHVRVGNIRLVRDTGAYIDFTTADATDFSHRIQAVGNYLDITSPSGLRVQGPAAPDGRIVLTGSSQTDAVLKSTTNLGRTGTIPLATLSNAALLAAPTGYSVMTGPGSDTPTGGYGYVFKMGRRDNGQGWSALWHSFANNVGTLHLGQKSDGDPVWTELWSKATLPRPASFSIDTPTTALLGLNAEPKFAFSPDSGVSWYNVAMTGRDQTFRDLTASRGDGTGAVFLGGGAYLYHNTSGAYEFGGNKDVNTGGNYNLTNPDKRVHINGVRQPRITVDANAPAANRQVGDLWAW